MNRKVSKMKKRKKKMIKDPIILNKNLIEFQNVYNKIKKKMKI